MAKLISKKKQIYPPNRGLDRYLREFNRTFRMALSYDDLLGYTDAMALYDRSGEDTLWSTLHYERGTQEEIYDGLLAMYAYMRAEGAPSSIRHLKVDRVDLCMYGNTQPFRVRITNRLNDNFEYFYVKRADANRIFGLELEHILSPNRIGFFVHDETLLEEHIYGIPGDMFRDQFMQNPDLNQVRLAKEFVKFNERCLLRLLGDMHASNFVVDITMDFEMNFYRIRAIDFDQQSYEGRLKVYRPQFFKQNSAFVKVVLDALPAETINQYQMEERSLMHRRMRSSKFRLEALFEVMAHHKIAPRENVRQLGRELAAHYRSDDFLRAVNMAELLTFSLDQLSLSPSGENL